MVPMALFERVAATEFLIPANVYNEGALNLLPACPGPPITHLMQLPACTCFFRCQAGNFVFVQHPGD